MGFLVSPQFLVRSKRVGAVRVLARVRLRPWGRMKGGDVRSKLVVFRERLQAIRFCTLEGRFSKRPTVLNPRLPSTASLPYASTRALSDAALSRTSSGNPLLGTRRGDRNQGDESGRELEDESLVDKTYCRSRTRTGAAIDTAQLNATDRTRKFRRKDPPPLCGTFRVLQAYTACYTTCHNQRKCNGISSSRFSLASR